MIVTGDNIANTRKRKRKGIMADAQHTAKGLGLGKGQSIICTMDS